jgi:GT2 family glycosyltransferase
VSEQRLVRPMLDFSIVVVSWNAKRFLQECLQSMRAEIDPARTEIILVDNASNDGSWEMVQECFPEVKSIRNPVNVGFARASNLGMRQSEGRYVCLVNSDVKLLNGCLDRLGNYLDQNPRVGMVGPQIVGSDGQVQRSYMGFPTLWNTLCAALALPSIFPRSALVGGWMLNHRSFDCAQTIDVLNGMFVMVRREALADVGMLDEGFFMYAEDMDWCRRFWSAGWEIAFCPDARAIHYGGASSANAPVRFYVEMNRSFLRYFTKHHGWLGRQAIRGIIALHQVLRVAGNASLYILRPTRRVHLSFKIRRSVACLTWLAGLSIPNEDRPVFRD